MKHTNSLRITATSQQLEEFERRCQLTELMLAGTLCGRFGIEKTNENLELVAGWMQTARSLGVIRLEMMDLQAIPRPRIVCLCGSTRFSDAFRSANLQETIAGRIVLSIGCDTKSDADLQALGELTDTAKAALDELHKRKIDLADEILVINIDDYIGDSTRSEVEYARANGKGVRWLSHSQHALPGEDGHKPATGEAA